MLAGRTRGSRRKWIWLAAIVVAVLGVAGLQRLAGDAVGTSLDEDFEQMVFVPVEAGRLTARVVTRGSVISRDPTAVLVAPSSPDRDPVLTMVPSVGASVTEGDVLYELAGRPVFALQGAIPAYRDVGPGDAGDDVEGLQAALERLGLYAGPLDGDYGQATASALEKLYTTRGYEPTQPPPELLEELEALLQQRADLADVALAGDIVPGPDSAFAELDRQIASVWRAQGTPFVRREFAYVPGLPSVVQTVDQSVGTITQPGSTLLTVSSGLVAVEVAFLEAGFEQFLGRDAEVNLDAGSSTPAHGVVTGQDVDENGEPTLIISSDALTVDHLGRNVRVSIVDRALTEVTLLAPVSAIITTGNGRSHVDKKLPDGTVVRVEVMTVEEADGTVALRPRDLDQLTAGDLVRLVSP